jgi:hypothetical protein
VYIHLQPEEGIRVHENTISKEQADIQPKNLILADFAHFEDKDYTFSPRNPVWLSWIMRRIWIIPLLLLCFSLTVNLAAILMSGETSHVINLATTKGEWMDGDTKDGVRYKYFEGETSTYFYYLACTNIDSIHDSKIYKVSFGNDHTIIHKNSRQPYCIRLEVKQSGIMLRDVLLYIGPLFFIFFLDALIFTRFIRTAPKSFHGLAATGRMLPGEASPPNRLGLAPRSWRSYGKDLDAALQSRWGILFGLFFIPIAYVISAFFMQGRDSIAHIQSGFLPDMLNEVQLFFILPAVLGFLIGLLLWVLLVVGIYVWWMTPTFNLDIQIGHSDGVGGLKRIGDILLPIALICIIPGLVFGAWGVSGILTLSIPAVLYLVYIGSAILLVAAMISFVLPAWKIHTEMVRVRTGFMQEANTHLLPVKKRLRELVTLNEENNSEGRQLRERLELFEKLYPEDIHFRSWPFSTQTLTVFSVSQVLSLLGIYSSFKDILDIFNNP